DWVIVGMCWNDINRKTGVMVSTDGWLEESTSEGQSLVSQWLESPSGYAIRNLLKRSREFYAVAEVLRSLVQERSLNDYDQFREDVLEGRDTARVTDGWNRFSVALNRLHDLSSQHGFRTLMVTFPFPLLLEGRYPQSSYPARVREL